MTFSLLARIAAGTWLSTLFVLWGCGPRTRPKDGSEDSGEVIVVVPEAWVGDPRYERHSGDDYEDADREEVPEYMDGSTSHQDTPTPLEEGIGSGDSGASPDTSCVPECLDRECGSDGCGGSCGDCKEGWQCAAGKCLCLPQCSGKSCGDDGCGGSCGECPENSQCIPGVFVCSKSGPCEVHGQIACAPDENTLSDNNGIGTHSDVMDVYSCVPGFVHGPEKVYSFVADGDGTLNVSLEGILGGEPPPFLDLYLLKNEGEGCSPGNCIAHDHTSVSVEVHSGEELFVAVDASENDNGFFILAVKCSWKR